MPTWLDCSSFWHDKASSFDTDSVPECKEPFRILGLSECGSRFEPTARRYNNWSWSKYSGDLLQLRRAVATVQRTTRRFSPSFSKAEVALSMPTDDVINRISLWRHRVHDKFCVFCNSRAIFLSNQFHSIIWIDKAVRYATSTLSKYGSTPFDD